MGFLLPTELMDEIFYQFSRHELKSLRRTCRAWNAVIRRSLFWHIRINDKAWKVNKVNTAVTEISFTNESSIQLLRHLPELAAVVQKVTISVCVNHVARRTSFWTTLAGIIWRPTRSRLAKEEEKRKSSRDFLDALKTAMPHLQSLRSLELVSTSILGDYQEEYEIFETLVDLFADLPNHTEISISSGYSPLPPSLKRLTNLRGVKLQINHLDDCQTLSTIFSNNPTITTLDVRKTRNEDIQLPNLFSNNPTTTSSLQHLTINRLCFNAPDVLPRFTQLRSLTILSDVAADTAVLWASFQSTYVELREIVVMQSCRALISYVGSYSGLKKVHVGTPDINGGTGLFPLAISSHQDTLVDVQIGAQFWNIGSVTLLTLESFHRLEVVDIPVASSGNVESTLRAIWGILDRLAHWRHLRLITLLLSQNDEIFKRVQEIIIKFTGQTDCRPLTIQIGRHHQYGAIYEMSYSQEDDEYFFNYNGGYLE